MIVLNPFLDSLCNFGFKNIGLHPGVNFEWFPDPQDAVQEVYSRCLMVSTDQADPGCFMNIDGTTLISFFLSLPFIAGPQK